MFVITKLYKKFYKYKRKLNLNSLTSTQEHQQRRELINKVSSCDGEKAKGLKILFFGTDTFSLPSLKILHRDSCSDDRTVEALGSVTSFKNPANCVRLYSEQQNLPLYRWPITSDICQQYDLGVVVSFGHLIPEQIIKAFPNGMINVHASLLPRWRGAAPIIYAIMNEDKQTGVSVMEIQPKHFDIGDILAQRVVSIEKNDLMPVLHEKLADEGANLLIEVIKEFPQRRYNAKKQNNEFATFAPKITATITEIVWSEMNAHQLWNRFRALYSFKYLNTKFMEKTVQLVDIKRAQLSPSERTSILEKLSLPGQFSYQRERKCLLVRCADDTVIELHQLRIEGKKVMTAMDFNNGFLKKLKAIQFSFSNKVRDY